MPSVVGVAWACIFCVLATSQFVSMQHTFLFYVFCRNRNFWVSVYLTLYTRVLQVTNSENTLQEKECCCDQKFVALVT